MSNISKSLKSKLKPKEKTGIFNGFSPKAIIFIVLLIGAGVVFGFLLKFVYATNLDFTISIESMIRMLAYIVLAESLFIMGFGFSSLFLKPLWLRILVFVISVGVLLFYMEINIISGILLAVLFLFSLLYNAVLVRKIDNQINFSAHPFEEAQKMLLLILSVVLSVTFAQGYINTATANGAAIPARFDTQIRSYIQKQAEGVVTGQIEEKKQKISDKDKNTLVEKAQEELLKPFNDLVVELNKQIKYIGIFLGVLFFSFLIFADRLLSWIHYLILRLFLGILSLVRVTKTETETVEVERLTL